MKITYLKRLIKFTLIGSIPLLILLGLYYVTDPFKVIRVYDNYSDLIVIPNRDYVSTEILLEKWPERKYDSFIFGSSRVTGFNPSEWAEYLPQNSKPFSFDAYSETMFGMHKKIKLLDSLNIPIKNAILLIDRDNSFARVGNSKGLIFKKHPILTGENSFKYKAEFLRAYLEFGFLTSFFTYKITGNYYPFMAKYLEYNKKYYDPQTNGLYLPEEEKFLAEDPEGFYKKYDHLFYDREMKENIHTEDMIKPEHVEMMKEIKEIFEKHHTNYKVIISPLYEMVKFNQHDSKIIASIFDNIYDFSGMNKFTENKTNYYEFSHFRPKVGSEIYKTIYLKK